MKKNAYIFKDDVYIIRAYDEITVIDMFGEDYLEEYGHSVPAELLERYLKNETERRLIAEELKKIMEAK